MLPSVVREAGRRFGDARALVAPEEWAVTYAELDRLSDEAAAGLARRGVGSGDVAALLLPSRPDWTVAYAALAKLGAVTAGVNPRLAPDERSRILETAQPRVLLATPELAAGVRTGAEVIEADLAQAPEGILRDLREPGEAPGPPPEDPDRPVVICFTSGTTGEPKGAVFANRQLRAIAEMDSGAVWGDAQTPMLQSTECVHVGYVTKLPWQLMAGMRIHMLGHWRAADALRVIARERIPSVGGIAAQVALMLREPDFDDYDLECVRTIVVGGGPSPPVVVREARERFGAAYSIRYSSTESGGLGTMTAFDAPDEEVFSTVGRPRPGIDLEIRDADDRPLPRGEVGEVCLRSPAMMTGYHRDPEATTETLRGGWLHTGDLGRLDAEGRLCLAGRVKEMFIRGGYNVYPAEVETVLVDHPRVADVAVIPRPDDVMGEIGVAVVVPSDPARPPTLEELRAFAQERLARYKLPEAIRVLESMPLTWTHKVDRRRLTAEEADDRA